MEALRQDVRFALRSLARRPLFTVLAVTTLGLGIAASTAMFSVVDAVLLQPLPYPEPEAVVALYPSNPSMRGHPTLGGAAERGTFSHPEYEDVASGSADVLEAVALVRAWGSGLLRGDGPPERLPVGAVTPGLFSDVLRVQPLVGRTFTDEDLRSGAPVILLTEGLWRRRFGADAGIVGRTIPYGSEPTTVLGVVPEAARPMGADVEAWTLFPGDENRGNHSYYAMGRLRAGVTPEQATSALSAVMAAADEGSGHGHGINVFPRHLDETRSVRGALLLLAVAALVLLLVACGNVAALMVGAAIDRERELAVRGAMGAGRGRLLQQLLTESVVLAGAGAAIGIALSVAATRGLLLLAPADVPRIQEAAVDPRALAVGIGLAFGCGILFGLVPALGFSRTDLRRAMTPGPSVKRGLRLQSSVVVGELALAAVLLVGAGLLVRTVLALNAVDPGFAAGELLHVDIGVPAGHLTAHPDGSQEAQSALDQFYRSAAAAVETLPGVRGVAITSHVPLGGSRANNGVVPEGYDGEESLIAERRFVSGDYFEVAGIPIVEGRGFTGDDDRFDAPDVGVVVVSEGLARVAWPGESPIGKGLQYWGDRETVVVGVARDLRDESLRLTTDFAFYVPMRQAGQSRGSLVVRVDGDPAVLAPAVRQRIWDVDGGVAIPVATPVASHLRRQVSSQVYRARLVAVFAALAALFSLMGIYGVTARSVAGRTRELGIRMALGAERASVMGLVLRQAVRLALWGGAVGLAAAFLTTRFIESYLWGVEATDLVTLVGTVLLLASASVVAALAPGRRATRVDPVEALRQE